jgi:hypothetical protein
MLVCEAVQQKDKEPSFMHKMSSNRRYWKDILRCYIQWIINLTRVYATWKYIALKEVELPKDKYKYIINFHNWIDKIFPMRLVLTSE